MSNRPKLTKKKELSPKKTIEKLKTPIKLRFYHHVGDMSGCGTIRIIFPSMIMNNFFSRDYSFESIYNNRFMPHQDAYKGNSIITWQRAAGSQSLDMIRHFKRMNPGRSLIYEVDDNLFDIPEWNFASGFYNKHSDSVKSIIRMMDGVVCSTPHLKKVLSPYNNNINVSPNHLPRFIWGDVQVKPIEEGRKPRIMYAGSHNHFDTTGSNRGDFSAKLIDFVSKTTKRYQWIFVGGMPNTLKEHEDIIHHEWKAVIEYPHFLKSLNPDICLAPLEDNEFNKSKSNIKALESVALGVPLIASDLEPYRGIPYTASNDEIFIGKIEELASNPDLRQSVWVKQHAALQDQLFWEDNDHKNLFDYINQHLRLLGKEI